MRNTPFKKNAIILFIVLQKFRISFVFNFSWEKSPQKKLKTMLMQNFGGTTKSVMVFLKKKKGLLVNAFFQNVSW